MHHLLEHKNHDIKRRYSKDKDSTCVFTRGSYALFHGGGSLIGDREIIAFAANEKLEEGLKEELENIFLFTIL